MELEQLDPQWNYDVFLSFRGVDTRLGFVSHLYHELQLRGIKTFKDDPKLERGTPISSELFNAIEESRLAIVVLSPNYASSSWCLDELAKILQCMKSLNTVLPVFYHVDPSDARKQSGSFAGAFAEHEKRFREDIERVKSWRAALTIVANLSSFDSKNQCERKLIENIVECVWGKLHFKLLDSRELVGMKFIRELEYLLLAHPTDDVRFVGIWGMVGIGKTNIAQRVYDHISTHFELSSFLANVREVSQLGNLVDLQRQLLSPILKGQTTLIWDERHGTHFIKKCFYNKKVLLILDDVSESSQLEKLAGEKDWFGKGSIIIITTRDKCLLVKHDIHIICKVEALGDDDALELFSWNAFKKKEPEEGYFELSRGFVNYARGLPLALELLGCLVYKRDPDEWKSELDKLRKIPNLEIINLLKTSYDGLDEMNKDIFLDVAFFHKGKGKEEVIEILDSCCLCGRIGINALVEKSLLTIDILNRVDMHDLIQEMALEIVRRECPEEPGRRSRLCNHDDISHVFINNTGTNNIKGIVVKLPRRDDIRLSASSFSKMINLKLFINSNAHFSGETGLLSNELRFIDWPEFSSDYLPFDSNPKKLVKLNMPHSRMSRLGEGFKSLENLKSINLESCRFLTEFPDASGFPNLMDLNLNYCISLVKVHHSVGWLGKLAALSLEGCNNLTSFPTRIALKSVKNINLRSCRVLKYSPEIVEKMKCITFLDLSHTAIRELPSSIGYLVSLEVLTLEECQNLTNLPRSIYELRRLMSVNLLRCQNLVKFPKWSAESLSTNSNISSDLWFLNLSGCKSLEEIPELPPKVERVNAADCVSLERFEKLLDILEHKEEQMIECITLFNCQKLCDNLANDVSKIENISPNKVSLCSVFLSSKQSRFEVVFPGREVPRWFNHRKVLCNMSDKSEFSFEIPRNFNLQNSGLAICAAVEINKRLKESMAQSNSGRCSFAARIDINGESVKGHSFNFEQTDVESPHVWLLYVPFIKLLRSTLPPFSCRVRLEHSTEGYVCCKSYGVHLVMPQDEDDENDQDLKDEDEENQDLSTSAVKI